MLYITNVTASENIGFPIMVGNKNHITTKVCYSNINTSPSPKVLDAKKVLEGFIDSLKSSKPLLHFLYSGDGTKINYSKLVNEGKVPLQLYERVENVDYLYSVQWGTYFYLGLNYNFLKSGTHKTVRWREDYFCANDSCYLSFNAARQENQTFELIYSGLVTALKTNSVYDKKDSLINDSNVNSFNVYPFGTSEKGELCPISIIYNYSTILSPKCLICSDNIITNNKIEKAISSFLHKLKNKSDMSEFTSSIDATIRLIGLINGRTNEAFINVIQSRSYFNEWDNVKVVGFLNDTKYYYVFLEYNYTDNKRGNLELLTLSQKNDKLSVDLNPSTSLGLEVLYRPEFLESLTNTLGLNEENKK